MRHFWRKNLLDGAQALPQRARPIVPGLLATAPQQWLRKAGTEALAACTPAERQAVWKLCFPAIAAEVELAWTTLPAQFIARRQGGPVEDGDPLTWPPGEEEARRLRFQWLSLLAPLTAAFPEYGLLELLQQERAMIEALRNSSLPGYDPHPGSSLNGDPLGYVAVAVLDRADASAEALLQALLQTIDRTETFDVGVSTALLCTSWPKAWEAVDARLAAAPHESRMQQVLLSRRKGIHPGAWRHFLETALRAKRGRAWFASYFSYRYRGLQAAGEAGALETLVKLQASTSARLAMLRTGSARDLLLALFAEAEEDGPAAVEQAMEVFEEKDSERRLAAAWFLVHCPEEYSHPRLARLVDDADFHVRAVAVRTLGDTYYGVYPGPIDPERLESILTRWPDPEPPPPSPWRPLKEARQCALLLFVANVLAGDEARIEPWLPQLGEQPREWLARRLNAKDHLGMLVALLRGAHKGVAEIAAYRLGKAPLASEALREVEGLLALRQPERRLLLLELIMKQAPEVSAGSARRLLAARTPSQRLAGLELLRRFAALEPLRAAGERLTRALPLAKRPNADEKRAMAEVRTLFSLAPMDTPTAESLAAEASTAATAFGLVDPATLPVYPEPRDRGVMLHSPNTVPLLLEIDALVAQHAEVEITTTDYKGRPRVTTFARGFTPSRDPELSYEENRKLFPLIAIWEDWWRQRSPEKRDPDGFELIRMRMVADLSTSNPPRALELIYGLHEAPALRWRYAVQAIIGWLAASLPPPDARAYLLDAAETAAARLAGEANRWPANHWLNLARDEIIARPLEEPDPPTVEEVRRYWQATQAHPQTARPCLWDALKARALGVATEDELIWHLLGSKEAPRPYAPLKFEHLQMATTPSYIERVPDLRRPEITHAVARCRDRLLELELHRGEKPIPASSAASYLGSVPGIEWFVRLVVALGSERLRRPKNSNDLSRGAVLSRLILNSHPAPEDTPAAFADEVRAAGIPLKRLAEIARVVPPWRMFVE
ncbi:MAG TPA: DUF5724 domain-containing protein, partial [Chthoniobacteraceae bacterium]|nr:DUF5724 domain-containing protein [Chthoniobacteraceae bacterium]